MSDSTQVVNTYGHYLLEIKSPTDIRHRSVKSGREKRDSSRIKSFKDQQKKEKAFDSRDRGIRNVPLIQIVGSVGRYHDFDDQFRFKQKGSSERYQRIKNAMRGGLALKPVALFR